MGSYPSEISWTITNDATGSTEASGGAGDSASGCVPIPAPTQVPVPAPTSVPIPAPTKAPIQAPTSHPIPMRGVSVSVSSVSTDGAGESSSDGGGDTGDETLLGETRVGSGGERRGTGGRRRLRRVGSSSAHLSKTATKEFMRDVPGDGHDVHGVP